MGPEAGARQRCQGVVERAAQRAARPVAVQRRLAGDEVERGGERARGVYDMVINCVEKPLLESVLHRVRGNQTHAAEMLGINRNTLRKKMKAHGIKF